MINQNKNTNINANTSALNIQDEIDYQFITRVQQEVTQSCALPFALPDNGKKLAKKYLDFVKFGKMSCFNFCKKKRKYEAQPYGTMAHVPPYKQVEWV